MNNPQQNWGVRSLDDYDKRNVSYEYFFENT